MSGEDVGGRTAGGGVLWLEVRAWFCEWAKDARKGRELAEALLADVKEMRAEVHGLAVACGSRRAVEVRRRREASGGPATSIDRGGVVVPACRICGCTWETIHERDGSEYAETNVFVESDLCRCCSFLGDDDEGRRKELVHLQAAAVRDLEGQTVLGGGEVRP